MEVSRLRFGIFFFGVGPKLYAQACLEESHYLEPAPPNSS